MFGSIILILSAFSPVCLPVCLHVPVTVYLRLFLFSCVCVRIYLYLKYGSLLIREPDAHCKKFGTGVLSGDVRKRSSAEVVAFNALLRALQCLPDNRLL